MEWGSDSCIDLVKGPFFTFQPPSFLDLGITLARVQGPDPRPSPREGLLKFLDPYPTLDPRRLARE
jgi:hypothetical protein